MANNRNQRTQQTTSAPAPVQSTDAAPESTQQGTADAQAQDTSAEQDASTQTEVTETNIPTPHAEPAPVLAPAVVQKEMSGSATQVTLESLVEKIKTSGDSVSMSTMFNLERYIDNMQPGKPLEKAEIVSNQIALWKTLVTLIEKCEGNFRQSYSVVLGLFEKHKDGVFNERYIFRLMSDVPLPPDDLYAFQALINLIKVTAPVQGRQVALKQNIDMSRTLSKVFSEPARQKLLDFYGM